MTSKRFIDYRIKSGAVSALRMLKNIASLKDIAEDLNIKPPEISRYVSGRVLPSKERALKILEIIREKYLPRVLTSLVRFRGGVVDVSGVIQNTDVLKVLAMEIVADLDREGVEITAVLTKEVDGIPLATLVASEVSAKLVYARRVKELGIERFIEVRQVFPDGRYSYIYVPEGVLTEDDTVLIVDDVLRSGSTIRALNTLCRVVGAKAVAAYVIVSLKDTSEVSKELGIPVKAFVTVKGS